jgi:hypothetical protein
VAQNVEVSSIAFPVAGTSPPGIAIGPLFVPVQAISQTPWSSPSSTDVTLPLMSGNAASQLWHKAM